MSTADTPYQDGGNVSLADIERYMQAGGFSEGNLRCSERARGKEPLSPGSLQTLEELSRYGALPNEKRRSREDAPSNDSMVSKASTETRDAEPARD